ncbi:MAG TPA: amidohydrolase family protein [Hyphomicrobiaceae bacterium]|jgi:predicted TIM-barrel fold metal-dependent hydrolase|nr:amidohydrolase family protein [Hyphomicrobiaceae bacterium]
MSESPLVDTHVHVFSRDMPLVANPRHRPTYDFTHEKLIATLDAHGVAFAVIAAASPWGDYNDCILEALRAHPRRLRGTAILQPAVGRYELEGMARDGFVGVRLPFIGLKELPDIASFDYRRFLRRLADLDWHVHLHVEGDRVPSLLPVIEDSGVKLVIDHMGRPDPQTGIAGTGFKAMLAAIERGRTWVKLSAAYRQGPQSDDYARELVRVAGPDRLMWASDCPFVGHESSVSYRQTVDWLVGCVPDAEARRKILGETALGFYFGASAPRTLHGGKA